MKIFLSLVLYLNICTPFLGVVYAQNLHLSLEAESTLPDSLLDSLDYRSTFSDYLSLKRETDTLKNKLQKIGYIESEMKSLHKKNDSSYIATFLLGSKYDILEVYFDTTLFKRHDLEQIANEVHDNYFILAFSSVETSLRKLNYLLSENGNPFAKVQLQHIEKISSNGLRAKLHLDLGDNRTIDSLVLKGYDKFPRSFLKYYAGIRLGHKFSQKKLISQNKIIDNLGFVESIKAPEALFREKTTTVYFYLKKQNNNLFDGILGFSSNEETQNLEFNGYLNLELNNNLNYGEQLVINYKADGNEQQNFRVKITMPYLFKSPFGLGAELKIFKRDSSFVTTEQLARLTYQLKPSTYTYIGYKAVSSSNLLDEVVAGNVVEDYKSRFAIFGGAYSKHQNNSLFPVKTTIALDAEIGTRERKGKNEAQERISILLNHNFYLNDTNSIFIQNNTSVLISNTYIENELFRFGGINSIRGFDENSIDATLYSVLNTEYRYVFNPSIYIHSIIDFGYFENQIFQQKEKLYSIGLGIGLQTKAGIFKLNIANGKSENQKFKFATTKIHLSMTSRF